MWTCHREMYIKEIMILRGQSPDGVRTTAASSFASKGVNRDASDTCWVVLPDAGLSAIPRWEETQLGTRAE